MALPSCEVGERYFVGSTDSSIHMMNLGGESVWREPFHLCVGIEKRTIDPFGRSAKDTVNTDSAWHNEFSFGRLCVEWGASLVSVSNHKCDAIGSIPIFPSFGLH